MHAVEEGYGSSVGQGQAAVFHNRQIVEGFKEDMAPHVIGHRFLHGVHEKPSGPHIFDIVMEAGEENGMFLQLPAAHMSTAP